MKASSARHQFRDNLAKQGESGSMKSTQCRSLVNHPRGWLFFSVYSPRFAFSSPSLPFSTPVQTPSCCYSLSLTRARYPLSHSHASRSDNAVNYCRLYALSGAIYQRTCFIPFPDCVLENMACPCRTWWRTVQQGRAQCSYVIPHNHYVLPALSDPRPKLQVCFETFAPLPHYRGNRTLNK